MKRWCTITPLSRYNIISSSAKETKTNSLVCKMRATIFCLEVKQLVPRRTIKFSKNNNVRPNTMRLISCMLSEWWRIISRFDCDGIWNLGVSLHPIRQSPKGSRYGNNTRHHQTDRKSKPAFFSSQDHSYHLMPRSEIVSSFSNYKILKKQQYQAPHLTPYLLNSFRWNSCLKIKQLIQPSTVELLRKNSARRFIFTSCRNNGKY